MKVSLLRATPQALDLLLKTKNTRLKNNERVEDWSLVRKMEELAYMRDTIKSSWAFVDYVFEVESVSRTFTHQLVRADGEYAQESQRTVSVDEVPIVPPEWDLSPLMIEHWEAGIREARIHYKALVSMGVPTQEARGIMPQNLSTSIIAKFDLKQLHYMGLERLCARTQGPYQNVFRAMREAVLAVDPWAENFIQVMCVANGICAFPRWGKDNCKIYDPRMDLTQLKADTKKKFWESPMQVAVPVANKGRTS